jgi:mRNA interferase HigB
MQIIGRKKITEAYKAHPEWKASLVRWVAIVEGAEWRHVPDMRQTFSSADPVGKYVIFNIGGNNARLAATVNFGEKRVTISEILSHAAYDRRDWEK